MANSKRFVVKNGLETQNIQFVTADGTEKIIATVLEDGTLSFSGTSGQLFSIVDSLTGSIFSVNDISGIPSIEVFDDGKVILAESTGNVGIGTLTPTQKLTVSGNVSATRLISTQATGTSPLAVTSTTKVDNLNADLLDGLDSTAFYLATNPSGYTTNTGTVTSVGITAGTGITVANSPVTTSGSITVTNSAPDQTVALTGAGTVSVTGTYPNFTITGSGGSGTVTSVSAGTQINGMAMTITNGTTTPSIATSISDAANFRAAIGAGTGNGTVTSVTGTSPVASSGGTAPAISLASGYGDTQNPYASKTQKTFLAAPNAADGVPTFRTIAASDVTGLQTALDGKISSTEKGAQNGVATLDALGLIPANQLGTWVRGGIKIAGTMGQAANDTLGELIEALESIITNSSGIVQREELVGYAFVAANDFELTLGTLPTNTINGGINPGDEGDTTLPITLETGDILIVSNYFSNPPTHTYSFAVLNNTYGAATSSSPGIVTLSSQNTYANLSGNNVVTDGVLKTVIDNAGFAVASNYLPLTGGNITGNLNASGNVGIGTTSTDGKLTVVTDTRFNNGNGFRIQSSSDATRNLLFLGASSVDDASNIQAYKDGTGVGVRNLLLNALGGNVGIGTTSPGSKLSILTNSNNASGLEVKDESNNSVILLIPKLGAGGYNSLAQANDVGIIFSPDGTGDTETSRSLLIAPHNNTNTSAGIKITESGNVGIGINPEAKLDVNGGLFVEREAGITFSGPVVGDRVRSSIKSSSSDNTITYHAFGNHRWTQGSSNTELVRITNTGNVGIGTTTPSQRLDVLGNARIQGNILLDGTATTTNQTRTISFTGFDKEAVDDFSDAAFIRHTVNIGGHAGSVLELSSQNDSTDGIALTTNASSQIRHNGHIMWDANNDGAASGLDADLLDGQHGSYFLDTSGSSQTKSGDLTVTGNISSGRYYQSANGIPTGNLGNPTVTEMALFDEQFYNQTAFYDISRLKFYSSTDGTTFTEITTITDGQKRTLVGGDNGGGVAIPNLTPYYRIEITNNGNYVFLNALYLYMTTSSHATSVKIRARRRSDLTFVNFATSNNTVNLWPGHVYLPFSTIPFLTGGSSSGHYDIVHIDFQPTWSGDPTYGTQPIFIQKLQIWGGYPAGKRNVFSTDENANVAFPATLTGSRLISNIATGNSPLVVTSTTVVTNLNADLLDGRQGSAYAQTGTDFNSNGSDINNIKTSGMWRLAENTNLPSTYYYGQVFVSRGGDTTAQILVDYNSASMAFRGASDGGGWQPWATVWNDLNDGAASGLDADLLDGNHASAFALDNAVVKLTGNQTVDGIKTFTSQLQSGLQGNIAGGNIRLGITTDATTKFGFITGTHYSSTAEPEGISLIGLVSNSTENNVMIGGYIYEANPATSIQFYTNPTNTNATGGLERMRITSDGNLGIGTTAPGYKLDVRGDSASRVTLANFVNNTNAAGTEVALRLSHTNNPPCDVNLVSKRMGADTGADFYIELSDGSTGADVERFRITEGGNVGIGTTSPGQKLDVAGHVVAERYRGKNTLVLNNYTTVNPASNVFLYSQPNDRDSWLYLDSADTGSNWGIYHRQIDSAVSGLPGNSIGFIGGGANTLQSYISLLNGDSYFRGNVGIGTTSPGEKLEVVGNIKHTGLVMTTGTNVDQTKSTTFASALTTSWTDVTGVSGTYLATGSYIVQIISNGEYYTGNMSWFSGSTTTTTVDEIELHRAGAAASAARIYARVARVSSGTLKLQVSASASLSSHTMTFTFRRTI